MQAPQVLALMRAAVFEGDCAAAMLYLTRYTFMRRIPSEGLPITVQRSCLAVCGDEIILRLARRKNKPYGSTI